MIKNTLHHIETSMNFMMLTAVIFDNENTLVQDSEYVHYITCIDVMKGEGLNNPENYLSYNEYLEKYIALSSSILFSEIMEKADKPVTPEKAKDMRLMKKELLFKTFDKCTCLKPTPGVEDFIISLIKNNIPFAVGTSADKKYALTVLEKVGLKKYFIRTNAPFVSFTEIPVKKPSPAIFLECERLLNVDRKGIVVFEDSDIGIQAAQSAGLNVIGIKNNTALFCINDFTDISVKKIENLLHSIKHNSEKELLALLYQKLSDLRKGNPKTIKQQSSGQKLFTKTF